MIFGLVLAIAVLVNGASGFLFWMSVVTIAASVLDLGIRIGHAAKK